ncbi:hypothetical protein [Deinococcus radiotolerans]|uniref:Uncharacterized protein n=1 Tax=Deinococcus radiotolerans TaxID=1309407 RepID=A0ABQ2FEI9_9DEIO|nr:hypothetical protein [Deinococcus radiotolerans]GGK90043.1 hypothetical protein GCM10010844_05760 [Deinococcus radiotolerans]
MRFPRSLRRAWQRTLLTLPGLFPLLPLLAVVLGQPWNVPDAGRWAAGNIAPALPELRPAPPPGAPVPFVAGDAPRPLVVPPAPPRGSVPLPVWSEPGGPPRLSVLGRRQSDGG